MDEFVTSFPGFGKQLSDVLRALNDEISDIEPAWNLKRTSGKIFLDIEWKFKLPAFPAIRTETELANCVRKQSPQLKQLDYETPVSKKPRVSPTSATSSKNRKKKSPSTRRRDRQRREKWLALKRSGTSEKKSSGDPVSHSDGTVNEARNSASSPRAETHPGITPNNSFGNLSSLPGPIHQRRLLPPTPCKSTKKIVQFVDSYNTLFPDTPIPGTELHLVTSKNRPLTPEKGSGYVAPLNQEICDLYDLEPAVDLCPDCEEAGFMACVTLDLEGNRECPRCEKVYSLTVTPLRK